MKKTYIKPQAQAVNLFAEEALLSVSNSLRLMQIKKPTRYSQTTRVGAAIVGLLLTKTNH